jgi:hypothetical protein
MGPARQPPDADAHLQGQRQLLPEGLLPLSQKQPAQQIRSLSGLGPTCGAKHADKLAKQVPSGGHTIWPDGRQLSSGGQVEA